MKHFVFFRKRSVWKLVKLEMRLKFMNEQIISYREVSFDLDGLEEDTQPMSKRSEPSFWDDSEKANQVIQKNNELKAIYDTFHKMELAHEETGFVI